MSFILNALRKSEQERQALQSETVNDRILLPQPQQKPSKATRFLVFLIVGNVFAIISIVWFFQYSRGPAPEITAQVIPKTSLVQEKKSEPKAMKAVQPEKPKPGEASETRSIAELIDEQGALPLAVKPIGIKKQVPEIIKQSELVNKVKLPIPNIPVIIAPTKAEPVPPETIAVKKDLPFLSELPFEFRQTVPAFTINVFVYSVQAEERFVMIDMVKYKPGQKIKNSMLLKEILPVSLVVVYQNQTFQIARP